MRNENIETNGGMIDVTRLTLRELDSLEQGQRERAIRQAFEHTIRNGVSMVSQSAQPEFTDLSIRHNSK